MHCRCLSKARVLELLVHHLCGGVCIKDVIFLCCVSKVLRLWIEHFFPMRLHMLSEGTRDHDCSLVLLDKQFANSIMLCINMSWWFSSTLSCREAIAAFARTEYAEGSVHQIELTLTEDKDKEKVIGSAADIRGGLFKFIDNINNPNVTKGKELYGLIVARVNEVCKACSLAFLCKKFPTNVDLQVEPFMILWL